MSQPKLVYLQTFLGSMDDYFPDYRWQCQELDLTAPTIEHIVLAKLSSSSSLSIIISSSYDHKLAVKVNNLVSWVTCYLKIICYIKLNKLICFHLVDRQVSKSCMWEAMLVCNLGHGWLIIKLGQTRVRGDVSWVWRLELETMALRRFAKISQSRRSLHLHPNFTSNFSVW